MTALPGWDSTPTDTASTVTPSSAIGSAARARMPVVVSPTWMPLTVVARLQVHPRAATADLPAGDLHARAQVAQRVVDAVGRQVLTTMPVVPPEVTRPSLPPIERQLVGGDAARAAFDAHRRCGCP